MSGAPAVEFVDCSSNNGVPDVAAYMAAGHQWLSRKVTEGTGYHWIQGDQVAAQVRAHHGRLVHYAWLRPDQDALAQAKFFVAATEPHFADGDRWMTDFELTYSAPLPHLPLRQYPNVTVAPVGPEHGALAETDAHRADQLGVFNAHVAAELGHAAGCIYTGNWYLAGKPQSIAVAKAWPVVMSDYSGAAELPNPYGLHYIAWQFTDSARVPGFPGPVDYNRWLAQPTPEDDVNAEQTKKIAQDTVQQALQSAFLGGKRGWADPATYTRIFRQAGKGRDADVVLVPQPSDSPNDPLNWPGWRKDLMLFLICIDTAVVGAWGPMISPGYVLMAAEFHMDYNSLNGGLGWGIFVIGISCFFTNSLAVIWGRRPVFLLGNLLLFISSLWGYFAHSYNSLLASRLIGCIGMSPFEVLVATTIADMYFVHERGLRLAMWGLCLSVGVGGGTIISGCKSRPLQLSLKARDLPLRTPFADEDSNADIIEDLGWNWTYGVCAIFFGVWIPVLFFFCPETAYRRDAALNLDLGTQDHVAEAEAMAEKSAALQASAAEHRVEHVTTNTTESQTTFPSEPKKSYWETLKIYNGRQSDDAYWQVLTRPLLMLIFPQVLFSFFAYGLTTSWLIVVGSVLAQIFTAPPYNFSISAVGLVSISALIGAILGAFVTGPLADWIIKAMARRNKGIYEPEFRLVIISVSLILGGISFFGFGWSLSVGDPWIVPVVFYGIQYFSVGFMTIAVYGYLTDCHRDKAPEAFASINLRNIYSFGMNYFISSWITSQGPKEVFCIVGGVHVFICLCAIPMYIFGKRCRSWTSRVPIFRKVMEA